ncbi:hypothetical protein [Flavobacterium beibuense]|uniref:Uncharacterized protein n=1 Tax=Flavobacterium beibuense TaxID=657326 RepID=A0A444WGD7_9FLAO|nr:hypothetical protein [Flavobacterium beibuense]RYJ44910.1 hypothetical protein NU09_0544 [Flavobacterium beibuense]
MENNSAFESFESQLSAEAKGFLNTSANWGLFLSIIGFIGCLFSLFGSLGMMAGGAAMGANPVFASMPSIGILMLVGTVVFFIPVLYLCKFSISVKKAIEVNDTEKLTSSIRNLKNYFMWAGILTIVWILSYGYLMISVIANAAELSRM